MADKENQALEYMRQKQWILASQILDQILSTSFNFKVPREKVISWLMNRTECSLELGRHEAVAQDGRKLIKIINDTDTTNIGARVRRRLVHSLFKLKLYNEAEQACREWMNSAVAPRINTNPEMFKVLERLRTVLQMANGQKNNQRISQQRLDEEMLSLDAKLEAWAIGMQSVDKSKKIIPTPVVQKVVVPGALASPPEAQVSKPTKPEAKNSSSETSSNNVNNFQKQIEQVGKQNEVPSCSYCALKFSDRAALRAHCSTHEHQTIIMSDEGKNTCFNLPLFMLYPFKIVNPLSVIYEYYRVLLQCFYCLF